MLLSRITVTNSTSQVVRSSKLAAILDIRYGTDYNFTGCERDNVSVRKEDPKAEAIGVKVQECTRGKLSEGT